MTPEERKVYYREYMRKYRAENPEKVAAVRKKSEARPERKEYLKEYYKTPEWREYQREKMKAYRATPAGARACKHQDLKKLYGIGIDDYERMLGAQNGGCAACGHVPGADERSLHVDHSHKTDKIRALLCNGCNTALGLLDESAERILLLLEYLKKYQ